MGILSINRNLLSKFKSKLKPLSSSSYSSDPCYIRRYLSAAAPSLSYGKTHVPTLAGDLTKPMFLIERLHEGCRNYYLLSAAADDSDSWKDHLHPIPNPLSSRHLLSRGCKEWTLFFDNEMGIEGDKYHRRVSLWNPTANLIHTFAPSFRPRPYPVSSIDIECSGFGFEPKSQDYKFVCFLLYNYGGSFDSRGQYHIEMYSLKTDSWKPITAYPPAAPFGEPSVCVNGVYYWVAQGGLSSRGFNILSFDFADEKFSVFRLPKVAQRRGTSLRSLRQGYHLVEFDGSLGILVHSDPKKEADQPFWFEVQVRPDKRWKSVVPKVTIGDDVLAGDRVANVLGLFQNDYLFLQGRNKGELMLFNVKTSKLENLGVYAGLKSTMLNLSMLTIFPFFCSDLKTQAS